MEVVQVVSSNVTIEIPPFYFVLMAKSIQNTDALVNLLLLLFFIFFA